MTDDLVLIGGGGHCKACIEIIESTEFKISGILDLDATRRLLLNYPVIGNDDKIEMLVKEEKQFLITIGQISDPNPRVKIYEKMMNVNAKFATVQAVSAIVSRYTEVGTGTIIMNNVVVNADTSIGKNCIINNKALIEHDCRIGDHTHVSTAAIVNGGCTIGQKVFVGSNSVLAEGVQIADNVVIGAGSVVIRNILVTGIYAGNPVRKIG